MYWNGYGLTQDDAEAVKWYRKAAEQGDKYGQYRLGVLYQYGYGVEKNLDLARSWLQKAAAQGDKNAKAQLAKLNQ